MVVVQVIHTEPCSFQYRDDNAEISLKRSLNHKSINDQTIEFKVIRPEHQTNNENRLETIWKYLRAAAIWA